ncbi:MAG: fucose isomerase [Opitutae bacterium]|nr:fucose isomerase [Opitutae bacterium]
MLRGISPLLSPDLLETMYRMGHHDEIIFGDAHFPGESCNTKIIRADGLQIDDLLDAVLPLFVLDHVVDNPVMMMEPLPEDKANATISADYQKVHDGYHEIVQKHYPETAPIAQVGKWDFYEQTKKAFAVVMTGDTRIYANLILAKGVTTW